MPDPEIPFVDFLAVGAVDGRGDAMDFHDPTAPATPVVVTQHPLSHWCLGQ